MKKKLSAVSIKLPGKAKPILFLENINATIAFNNASKKSIMKENKKRSTKRSAR